MSGILFLLFFIYSFLCIENNTAVMFTLCWNVHNFNLQIYETVDTSYNTVSQTLTTAIGECLLFWCYADNIKQSKYQPILILGPNITTSPASTHFKWRKV